MSNRNCNNCNNHSLDGLFDYENKQCWKCFIFGNNLGYESKRKRRRFNLQKFKYENIIVIIMSAILKSVAAIITTFSLICFLFCEIPQGILLLIFSIILNIVSIYVLN